MNTPVIILGLVDTGLYAAQSLGGAGIPVFGYDHDQRHPGFYSRYVRPELCTHPFYEPEPLLKQLMSKAKTFGERPILLASTEDYLGFIARHRLELGRQFHLPLPEPAVLDNILNKRGQFEIARDCDLAVPDFAWIVSKEDLLGFLRNHDGSKWILKAGDQPAWKANVDKKAFTENRIDKALQIGETFIVRDIPFVIQKYIEGDYKNNYEYNALMFDGEVVEECVVRKLRQYPPEYGAASCIQTFDNPQIEELGRHFIKKNRIEGFSNTEFKWDPVDGKYYFIETNARVWQQVRLTEPFGQNFLLAGYNHFASKPIKLPTQKTWREIKWTDAFADYVLWWRHLRKSGMGFCKYMRSLSGTKNFGLLNLSDMRPFFHEIFSLNMFHGRKKRKAT